MITQLNLAKEAVTKMTALVNRYIKTIEQRELAQQEDSEARAKLTDPSLPSDKFMEIANKARAAQRRRANLHDKAIEIEESFRNLGTDLIGLGQELVSNPMPRPLPADAAAVADQAYLEEPVDEAVEQIAEEGFVEVEESAA